MSKTIGGEGAAGNTAEFFNNFVVESVDKNGRTSMRQIVSSDRNGRPSVHRLVDQGEHPNSVCSGPNIKFVRKSEISQEIYENKSVISIGGDRKVSIKYGASAQLASQIAANLDFSLTVPP